MKPGKIAMPPDSKTRITCYSEEEGEFMRRSQHLRAELLRPLLATLARLHVSPNHLTLFSLLAGLAFCPVFLWCSKLAAFGLLLLHVLLDGLDGPLARHTQRASNRGSFTDTAADQIVVAFSTLTMIHAGYTGAWPGGLYLFCYSLVVVFAMVRNALAIPYSWLVRPRFLVYGWMPVEVYIWRGSLEVVLWLLTILLAIKTLTGFIQIRRKI
jgi:phosphatidylglycerophosphate synthase